MVSDEVKAHINIPSSVVASRLLNDLHNWQIDVTHSSFSKAYLKLT